MEEYGQEWVNGEASLTTHKELRVPPSQLTKNRGAEKALRGIVESKRQ